MLIVFSVFQLVGCDKLSNLGKTKTEGEKADASEEENEEVTSDEKEEEKIGEGRKKQWLRGSFNGKIVPLCLDMCLLAQEQ